MKNLIIILCLLFAGTINAQVVSISTEFFGESELGNLDIVEVNNEFFLIRGGQGYSKGEKCRVSPVFSESKKDGSEVLGIDCSMPLTGDEIQNILRFIEEHQSLQNL